MSASKETRVDENKTLVRRLGLGGLCLIGIGDILGAGIYALVGKVVGIAGPGAWISFLISAFLAVTTGLAYAELSSRIPKCAGAAAYAAAAFRQPIVSFLVGFLVLASGLTSTATVALAIHGYLSVLIDIPDLVAALALVLILAWITYRGIGVSAWTNHVLTFFEAAGLLIVIGAGIVFASGLEITDLLQRLQPNWAFTPLLAGATLAFYAFIGFEDLANLAEEAKNPRRDLPIAIIIAVAVTAVIYIAVIVIVLWTLGVERAAASSRPLLDALEMAGVMVPGGLFSLLAIFAITNTGLANFVMVSRLLYGMARQNLAPRYLAQIDPVRRTPKVAILVAAALAFILAATGGVRLLAQTTSLLLVIVFAVLHLSLIRIRRGEQSGERFFRAPAFVPWVGLFTCLFLSGYFPAGAFFRAGVILVIGAFMAMVFMPRSPRSLDLQS